MLKISQNTFLHSLSISCLCLSLSSLSFAMESENEEGKPHAPAATFAAVVKGDTLVKDLAGQEESKSHPLSRNFFPLSEDDRSASQALLEKLKTFNAPENQKPLFEEIHAARVSIKVLWEKLYLLLNPPSSSAPKSALPSPDADSGTPNEKDPSIPLPTNLLLSSNSEIAALAQQIKATVDTLVDSFRNQFGLTITYLGNPRVSESFYKGLIEQLASAAPSTSESSSSWDLFCKEEESHLKKYEDIIKDEEKLYLWQPTRAHRAKYYLTEDWKDLKVLTITPYNFHLYAAMIDLLDENYEHLGLLEHNKSILEGASGFKYGPYDKRYVHAYILRHEEKVTEKLLD